MATNDFLTAASDSRVHRYALHGDSVILLYSSVDSSEVYANDNPVMHCLKFKLKSLIWRHNSV